jgi:hypothetical protein
MERRSEEQQGTETESSHTPPPSYEWVQMHSRELGGASGDNDVCGELEYEN